MPGAACVGWTGEKSTSVSNSWMFRRLAEGESRFRWKEPVASERGPKQGVAASLARRYRIPFLRFLRRAGEVVVLSSGTRGRTSCGTGIALVQQVDTVTAL